MLSNSTTATNINKVLYRNRRSMLLNTLNTDVDAASRSSAPLTLNAIRSFDKFTNVLESDSSFENVQVNSKAVKVGIGKYTPEGIARILNMLQHSKHLKVDHSKHLIGFLSELKDLEEAVLVKNLKLLKKKTDLNESILSNLLLILLKSDIEWPMGHLNTILRVLYNLDKYQLGRPLDPKGIMHTKWEKMRPHEIAYFHDIITSGQGMSTEKYFYLTKFLSRLTQFSVRQFNDYISFLNANNLLGDNGMAVLLQFLKDSRSQWKPLDYQKLNNLLNMNLLKKTLTNIKKHKPRNEKTKSVSKAASIVRENIDKPIVHHQDNRRFNIVMESLLMDGLLNSQKLNVLENFLQTLAQMNTQELHDYLLTLKRRKIINTRIMVYLKQVLLENLIRILPSERNGLVKAFSLIIDQKLEKTLVYPAIAKYHLDLKAKKMNHAKELLLSAIQNSTRTNTETNAGTDSNLKGNNAPLPASTSASSSYTNLVTNLNTNPNQNASLNVSANYKYLSPVKMSPLTREKVDRLFLRLKTSVYLAQRLKFYQNMFRAGDNRLDSEDIKDFNIEIF